MPTAYVPLTRQQLRDRVGRIGWRDKFVSGLVVVSPDAPTSTTFALQRAKLRTNGHYRGQIAYAVLGTGSGQSGYVSNSAVGTGVLTITPALSVTFDATTRVEGWPEGLDPDSINEAINEAIDDVANRFGVYVEELAPTLDSERMRVTVPTGWNKLVDVTYTDAGGNVVVFRHRNNPDVAQQEQWRDFTVRGGLIRLSEPIGSTVTDIIVRGYRAPAHPVLDTDVVECNPAFLTYKVIALLEQSGIAATVNDPQGHQQRASTAQAQAQLLRQEINGNWLPNTVELD